MTTWLPFARVALLITALMMLAGIRRTQAGLPDPQYPYFPLALAGAAALGALWAICHG